MEEVKEKIKQRNKQGKHWTSEECERLSEWDDYWNVNAETNKLIGHLDALVYGVCEDLSVMTRRSEKNTDQQCWRTGSRVREKQKQGGKVAFMPRMHSNR